MFQGPAQTALGVGSPPFTTFPHSPPFSLLSAPKADLQWFSGFQQGSDSRGPWAGSQGREERRAGVLVSPSPRFLPAGFYVAPSVTHPARSSRSFSFPDGAQGLLNYPLGCPGIPSTLQAVLSVNSPPITQCAQTLCSQARP